MAVPLIGITCSTQGAQAAANTPQDRLNRAYSRAVAMAGGIPAILPNLAECDCTTLLSRLDGLLLSGGVDLAPGLYGECTLNETVEVDSARDEAEVPLVRAAVSQGVPILGICRGIQLMNVALGGSLYQDIPVQLPEALPHRQNEPRERPTHAIDVDAASRLAELAGSRMEVNSMHHQAVKDVAPGLRVTARARDGVVEALEGVQDQFLLAVQFHPEEMTAGSPEARRLFEALIAAARR